MAQDNFALEVVGIICITCECGEKFVVSTTKLDKGAYFRCSCGELYRVPYKSKLKWEIEYENGRWTGGDIPRSAEMMPLSEYKTKVAEWAVTGKRPKVPAKNKNAVEFDTKGVNIEIIAKSLQSMGLSRSEAVEKIKSAIEIDILAEEDIVKYVLTQL